MEAILKRVDDNAAIVRIKAIRGLATFKDFASLIEPILVRVYMDKDELPKMRGLALQSLVQLKPESSHLRSIIYQCMDDENNYIVRSGIEQLGSLNVSTEEKIKLITYGLNHEDMQCRLASLQMLQVSAVDPAALLYRVIELLHFYNVEVKTVALELIIQMGSKAKEAFVSIITVYQQEQGALKVLALKALTTIDIVDDRLKAIIRDALHVQNSECRDIALDAVVSLGEVGIMFEQDVDSLKQDQHPSLRFKAEQLKFN